jgi:phenylpropionate dioxygenase-like ring-hydroxylating dioxygenase large terminal subunit
VMPPLPATDMTRDLNCNFSLPPSWFTDPAVAALEYNRIFHRTWQYVGRTEQLSKVGDFITGMVGNIPVVVVNNGQGLTGLVNVCRHRRHLVMSGVGNGKVLQCPYHAWTYDLEGCLRAVPGCEHEDNFRKEDYPLLPLRVDTWGPFVFVNADAQAKPLAHYLSELPDIIAQSGLDLTQLKFRARQAWRAKANWKVMIENYLECYHCSVVHSDFTAIVNVEPSTFDLKQFEWFSSQCAPVRASALQNTDKQPSYDAHGAVEVAQYHFLWPNLTININPGHPNLSLDVWHPDGPNCTKGFSEHYFGPDVSDDYAEQVVAFNKKVSDEDDAITDSVQLGMKAGLPMLGGFLTKRERLIIHFEKLVLEALS